MLKYSLLNRSIIEISGLDSKIFLQSLITQDINLLDNNISVVSLLLTNKGRYLTDFFIIINNKKENSFYIDINKQDLDLLYEKLSFYKLRSKVSFEFKKNFKVFAVFKNDISNNISQSNSNTYTFKSKDIIAFIDPRTPSLGLRILLNNLENKSFLEHNATLETLKYYFKINSLEDVSFVKESNYTELRYLNKVPENTELTKEKSIPLECGFEALNAISFNKGCYLGQEFTNASKRTLVIRKSIITFKSLSSSSVDIKQGDEITNPFGNKVGIVMGCVNNYIMALVKIDLFKESNNFKCGTLQLQPVTSLNNSN